MQASYALPGGIHVLPGFVPLPGLGQLPVNAFVLEGDEPILVDTGLVADRDQFLKAVRAIVDLADLRWLWLTHADPDHTGSLLALLAEAPRLRVVTNYLAAGKASLLAPIPPERFFLVNPGQTFVAGHRTLLAVRPPTFDAPETMGFLERGSKTLFSSDCFGALGGDPVEDARAIPAATLAEQQLLWATVDAPWLHRIDRSAHLAALDVIRELEPELICSSHLPPAPGMVETFLDTLALAPDATPFVGPDQAMLERALGGEAQAAVEELRAPPDRGR